jgi:hypothetical protein
MANKNKPVKSKWIFRPSYEIFKPTNDDWYPNFDNNLVSIRVNYSGFIHSDLTSTWYVYIVISGNDDTMIRKEAKVSSEEAAKSLFHTWLTWVNNLSFVERTTMIGLGFYYD